MVGSSQQQNHHMYGNQSNDSSYSMLFSPAASSLASTPGGGMNMHGGDPLNRNSMSYTPSSNNNSAGNGNINLNSNINLHAMDYQNQQQQQQQQQNQQQQDLELNWDPTRVKSELLKASAVLSHRCLKLAGKWAAEQVTGIPVGIAHPVVAARNGSNNNGNNTQNDNNSNHNDINVNVNISIDNDPDPDVDLSFNTNDCSLDQQEHQMQDEENTDPSLSMIRELSQMSANDWYAKTLFELGEFLHAASVLSGTVSGDAKHKSNGNNGGSGSGGGRKDITQMGPPRADLSSYGFYLRAYALYMAGERRKEEEYSELEGASTTAGGGATTGNPNEGGTQKTAGTISLAATSARVKNPYMAQLIREVSEAYEADASADEIHSGNGHGNSDGDGDENHVNNNTNNDNNNNNTNHKLDAFGLYVYGLLLKEAKKESIPCPHPPHMILVESLLEFPLNWSAWLDLCEVLVGGTSTNYHEDNRNHSHGTASSSNEQQVEQALQPALATHYMYHFFCAHLMAHHHGAHEDALVLLERLYEPLPDQPLFQSPHVKTQLAVVFYYLRELEQALMWFGETAEDDKYSLEHKDVYSNILYVKEDRVGLSHLAHEAVVIDKYRPETCCIVGNYYSLKQQRHKAVLYFQRALKLDRSYTSAWTLMGHEYVELKQTEQAMESYRRAVTVSPKDYRAWYGLGQTYELLNMYLYALFYYRKAATLRPYDPRMWCAVGQCFSALHKIPDAIRAYERAVAQEDNEGIATQKLAALYRQGGKKEEAARCYLRHLELRYLITSAAPEHQSHHQHQQQNKPAPTLDAIVQGIVLESVEAEALLFLAQYYKSHGEFDTAALLCSRLVEYPGPEKELAKGLLRDLRSRGRRYPTRSSPGGRQHPQQQHPHHISRASTPGGNDSLGSSINPGSPFQFSP